jgi:hypothetical protein
LPAKRLSGFGMMLAAGVCARRSDHPAAAGRARASRSCFCVRNRPRAVNPKTGWRKFHRCDGIAALAGNRAWPFTWNRRGQGEQPPPGSRWNLWFARLKARLARSKAQVQGWAWACGDVYGSCCCPEPRAKPPRLPRTFDWTQRRLTTQLTRTCVVSRLLTKQEKRCKIGLRGEYSVNRAPEPGTRATGNRNIAFSVNIAIPLMRRSCRYKLSQARPGLARHPSIATVTLAFLHRKKFNLRKVCHRTSCFRIPITLRGKGSRSSVSIA